jgi:hypothetical protein
VTPASRLSLWAYLPLAVSWTGLRLLPVPGAFAATVGLLLAVRLVHASTAREPEAAFLPRRLRAGAWVLAFAAAAGLSIAGGPPEASGAAVVLGTLLEGLWLLGPQSLGTTVLLLVVGAFQTVAVAVSRPDAAGLAHVLLYCAALLPALVALERLAWNEIRSGSERGVRRVEATPRGALRARAVGGTVAVLALVGLLVGSVAYAVAVPLREAAVERGARPRSDPDPVVPGSGFGRGDREGRTGARVGARLGFVSRVKRDTRPALAVRFREDAGSDGSAPVYLRTATYDRFSGREWASSDVRREVRRDADDGREDGWIPLAPGSGGAARGETRTTRVRDLQGGDHLHLLPEASALRFDEGLASEEVAVDGSVWKAVPPLEGGDAYEVRSDAWRPGARALAAAASDPSVRQPAVRDPRIRALARDAVGAETRVAGRADLLAERLRADYAYALDTRGADPDRPVDEFLFRTRKGTCEHFASAMVLLLRSLGHPARLAVGYRVPPDAWIPSWGEYLVRSSHAHAWVEVAFEDLGWVRWDPTPPDRSAVDARPADAEEALDDDHRERGLAERVLRLREDDRRVLVARLLEALGSPFVLVPAGVALAALALRLGRRHRRGRDEDPFGAGVGTATVAPYRRALRALEREGLRRRRSETPSEYLAAASRRIPACAPAFVRLTRGFEGERYGARPADPASGEADADEVVAAARAMRDRSPSTS